MPIKAKTKTRLCINCVYIGLLRQIPCEGRSPFAVSPMLSRCHRVKAVIHDPLVLSSFFSLIASQLTLTPINLSHSSARPVTIFFLTPVIANYLIVYY